MIYNSPESDASQYGIVNVSVANLRLQPVYQSELVNQLILGVIVPVFEEQKMCLKLFQMQGSFE